MNELVNNGADSAIFGEVGSTLLNTWNYNASTFGDFHNNFQNWTEVVSVIAANNAEFVVTAESIYANHGLLRIIPKNLRIIKVHFKKKLLTF